VVVNIQVSGTGQKPLVSGYAKIQQLTASLPFSHMDISNSYINFNTGGNPLDPQLNIVGHSTVRDYDITMRIYGPVSNFKILFDSTPPLTQGDIATLLATGSTSSEFVQDPSILAGRAAFLVIRQLYSKIFKGGAKQQQQQEFLDRLEVDVIPGQKVGSQDISARFSVTRSWQVVAEFGSIGNVSGQLRYLIRFR
jgi:autotransporter translocation and assembly factor TamB